MTGRPLHERMVEAIVTERDRRTSRRGLLSSSAKIAGGSALAMAAVGSPAFSSFAAAQEEFEDDVAVLNFALTLEHLEYAFYRDGLEAFANDLGVGPFDDDINERLTAIRDHEQAHVETLTSVIEDLGGEPVQEAEYNFGYTDVDSFIATAQVLETTGVSAYDGAGQFLESPDLLTAAGTIAAVEARHSAYLNLLTGIIPFPASFEDVLTQQEVLDAVSGFIVSDEATPA